MNENKGSHTHGPSPINMDAIKRLKSVSGQIEGIRKMVEDEKYCIDILNQISSVRSALNSVGLVILKRHIEGCVLAGSELPSTEQRQLVSELMTVLSKGEI